VIAILGLAAMCFVMDMAGTAIMLLVMGVILASCFADRLGFIRILGGLAVVVGGAIYGYEFCPPYAYPVDRVSTALVSPFMFATLTGTPRIPGETWARCAGYFRCGPGVVLLLVSGLVITTAAALGYARRRDAGDAVQWGFCSMCLLVFHIICNAFRDTAHSAAFPDAQPTVTSPSRPQLMPEWQAAAAKMPRSVVLEEDLHGSTASSPHVPRCTVCIEEFKAGEVRLTLPCFHGFHPECVESWIEANGRCPVCRHSILENDASDENA